MSLTCVVSIRAAPSALSWDQPHYCVEPSSDDQDPQRPTFEQCSHKPFNGALNLHGKFILAKLQDVIDLILKKAREIQRTCYTILYLQSSDQLWHVSRCRHTCKMCTIYVSHCAEGPGAVLHHTPFTQQPSRRFYLFEWHAVNATDYFQLFESMSTNQQ